MGYSVFVKSNELIKDPSHCLAMVKFLQKAGVGLSWRTSIWPTFAERHDHRGVFRRPIHSISDTD